MNNVDDQFEKVRRVLRKARTESLTADEIDATIAELEFLWRKFSTGKRPR